MMVSFVVDVHKHILNTIVGNYYNNSTVIISTHLITDAENVLDKVIFLQDGQY